MFWFALGFFCVVSGGFAPWQAICQSEPSLLLEAGQSVAANIGYPLPQDRTCQAILSFQDIEFLPTTVNFSKSNGTQLGCRAHRAEFVMPTDVPNGPMSILWLCAGQRATSCVNASIVKGRGIAKTMPKSVTGRLECAELPSQSITSSTTGVPDMRTNTTTGTTNILHDSETSTISLPSGYPPTAPLTITGSGSSPPHDSSGSITTSTPTDKLVLVPID
ncbi:hypothetical protein Purlil1_14045 [Purpureocillium lilacinum]|uniref:Uncharacterized protein n=1 Tax=Purpureocillium lilacinum TaxID=33203 RepID=A0ABR0BCE8_PURLI|nr:hypothetical protein Purlil1_14045 [Purpureocillium lilacinum]